MTAVANRGTRWCPVHETSMVRRGTRRCRRCRVDLSLPKRPRIGVPAERLKPMRIKGQPTQRANERRTTGYR